MISVAVTPEILKAAEHKAKMLGALRNSLRGGEGNLIGMLGEEAFLHHFKDAEKKESYDYDIIFKGHKLEIKTQQRFFEEIRPNYRVIVSNINIKQEADFYVFMNVFFEYSKPIQVDFFGYYQKQQYIDHAKFIRAGETTDNWKCKNDCYMMYIRDLKQFSEA